MPDDAPILAMLGNVQRAVDAARAEQVGAINGLRAELSGRMDQMITRREHDAEVRRLDAESEANRQAIEGTRQALTEHETAGTSRREEAERQRVADRRWLIGILLLAVSVASAVTGTVVTMLGWLT